MADTIIRPDSGLQISPTAVRWTRDDCDALERAGVLTARYELVEGMINKMGPNWGHAEMIRLLIAWLSTAFGVEYYYTQSSIDVLPEDNPTSAPQPDGIVLNRPARGLGRLPSPADISLLVEASDTTLAYDLTTKAALYARAGIVEYWVVNLPDRRLHVHRRPAEGIYHEVLFYSQSQVVSPLAAPEQTVGVSSLLPDAVPQ